MKLYTEEQVRHLADCIHGADTEKILASLTPIELPSDEEISKKAEWLDNPLEKVSWEDGVKWLRDKIKGGNNEQKVISETASTNTAAGFWVKDLKIQGGISSVAQPFPEEYVVRGQSQPTEQMSNNKQSSSSIDWLISQLQKSKDWHRVFNEISQMSSARVDIIEQAKAMHKEEIIKAMSTAFIDGAKIGAINYESPFTDWEHYYHETFGGNNEQS